MLPLSDNLGFRSTIIQESSSGRIFLTGKVQSTLPNRNKRRYSEALWDKLHEDGEFKLKLSKGLLVGGIGHPKDGIFDPSKTATTVREHWRQGNEVFAKREILPTPEGNVLKTLFQSGVEFGTSSRGRGDSSTNGEGVTDVLPGFVLEGYDDVIEPSVKDAYNTLVQESLETMSIPLPISVLTSNIGMRLTDKQLSSDEYNYYKSFCEDINPTVWSNILEVSKPKLYTFNTGNMSDENKALTEQLATANRLNEESTKKTTLLEQRLSSSATTIVEQRSTISRLESELSASKKLVESNTETISRQNALLESTKKVLESYKSKLEEAIQERDEATENATLYENRYIAARKLCVAYYEKDNSSVTESVDEYKDRLIAKLPNTVSVNDISDLRKLENKSDITVKYNSIVESIPAGSHDPVIDKNPNKLIEGLDPLVRAAALQQQRMNVK